MEHNVISVELLTYLGLDLSLRRNSNGLTLSSGIVLHLEPQYLLGDMSLHLFDVLGVMHHQFTSTVYIFRTEIF